MCPAQEVLESRSCFNHRKVARLLQIPNEVVPPTIVMFAGRDLCQMICLTLFGRINTDGAEKSDKRCRQHAVTNGSIVAARLTTTFLGATILRLRIGALGFSAVVAKFPLREGGHLRHLT